ncbi:hypothetical protein MBH78_01250 [Oceanimonas sp. NS1]|nr:hypothetical protein [Oceanimonas sp. NS1]
MRFSQTGLPLLAALVLSACASKGGDSNTASVNLEVLHGPTFIEGGNATGEQDITVRTPYFALPSVPTVAPWWIWRWPVTAGTAPIWCAPSTLCRVSRLHA